MHDELACGCTKEGRAATVRLRLDSDHRVVWNLCAACLRNQALLTAREEGEEAAVIREAAHRIGGSVWLEGGTLFLIRRGPRDGIQEPLTVRLEAHG